MILDLEYWLNLKQESTIKTISIVLFAQGCPVKRNVVHEAKPFECVGSCFAKAPLRSHADQT